MKFKGTEQNPHYELVEIETSDVKDGIITVPDGVEIVGSYCNRGLQTGGLDSPQKVWIKELRLPDTVKQIRSLAFYQLEIKEIKIPKSVETVGTQAFINLPYLEEVNNQSKLKPMGNWFFNCPELELIKDGLQTHRVTTIQYWLYKANKVEDIDEPNGKVMEFVFFNPEPEEEGKYSNIYTAYIQGMDKYITDTNKEAAIRELKRHLHFNEYIEKYKDITLDDKFPLEDYLIISGEYTDSITEKIKASKKSPENLTVRQLLKISGDGPCARRFGEFIMDIISRR